MNVITAPDTHALTSPTVFLAGSIEQGTADMWQEKAIKYFSILSGTVCNPRRENWDNTWNQDGSNAELTNQITWELEHLEKSDYVLFYFDPNTKSPITLLELGLMLQSGKHVVVVCSKEYWRYANVAVTCKRYWVPVVDTLEEGLNLLSTIIMLHSNNSLRK